MTPAAFLQARQGHVTLFANEEEALSLSGAADVDAAMDRLSRVFVK